MHVYFEDEWSVGNFSRMTAYVNSYMKLDTVLDTYCYLYGTLQKRQVNTLNQLVTNEGIYNAKQKRTSHSQLLHILYWATVRLGHTVALCIQEVERPCYVYTPRTLWESMNFNRMKDWVSRHIRDSHELFEAYCFYRGVRSLFDLKVINMLVTDFGEHTHGQDEISRVQLRQILLIRIKAEGY